jgi:hypothetical protein
MLVGLENVKTSLVSQETEPWQWVTSRRNSYVLAWWTTLPSWELGHRAPLVPAVGRWQVRLHPSRHRNSCGGTPQRTTKTSLYRWIWCTSVSLKGVCLLDHDAPRYVKRRRLYSPSPRRTQVVILQSVALISTVKLIYCRIWCGWDVDHIVLLECLNRWPWSLIGLWRECKNVYLVSKNGGTLIRTYEKPLQIKVIYF